MTLTVLNALKYINVCFTVLFTSQTSPLQVTDGFGTVRFNVLATPRHIFLDGELLRETSVHTSYPKITTFLVNKIFHEIF